MLKLQLKPDLDGLRVREQPVSGKPIGQIYAGEIIESLEDDATTASKIGVDDQWIEIKTSAGVKGFTAAWMLAFAPGQEIPAKEPDTVAAQAAAQTTEPATKTEDTVTAAAETGDVVALKPTIKALRLRAQPVDGDQVGLVSLDDVLISMEDRATTEAVLGVKDKWLHVKTIYGQEAYTAAWFLETYDGPIPEPEAAPEARSIWGMNLDIDHPHGRPDPTELQPMGWIRIKFNVSFDPQKQGDARYGNTDVDYTYNRYIDFINRYVAAGYKILMVLTHQAYGEGAGYHWPSMTPDRWRDLTPKYAEMAKRIATKFAGQNKIVAYQIWNEQDTAPEHARAAVPIPAKDYAHLLSETITAIRSVDPNVKIITGGHVGGPGNGSAYARETLANMPAGIRPDGIAFHPYGRGVNGHKFSIFGPLSESIQKYGAILPGKPLWISEWGVLDHQGRDDLMGEVMTYANGFIDICNKQFPGQVATAIWYAWADSMDNGYGFVKEDGSRKQTMFDGILKR